MKTIKAKNYHRIWNLSGEKCNAFRLTDILAWDVTAERPVPITASGRHEAPFIFTNGAAWEASPGGETFRDSGAVYNFLKAQNFELCVKGLADLKQAFENGWEQGDTTWTPAEINEFKWLVHCNPSGTSLSETFVSVVAHFCRKLAAYQRTHPPAVHQQSQKPTIVDFGGNPLPARTKFRWKGDT